MTAHRRERDAFVSAASAFCRLCVEAGRLGGERFMLGLVETLPRLHLAAVALPYPDDTDEIPTDDLDVDVTDEELEALAASLRGALDDLRWDRVADELDESIPSSGEAVAQLDELFDDLRASGSPALPPDAVQDQVRENLRRYLPGTREPRHAAEVRSDVLLFEDLTDIYRDLEQGLRLVAAGRPEAEAVFVWRLTFWSHWGYHLVEALRVVHVYVASESLAG